MAINIKYPFEQENVFSISLSFSRLPAVPQKVEMPINIQFNHSEPVFPRIQVNMVVKSPPESEVSFSVEAVGIFKYIGEKTEYDYELIQEFIQERALHIIWTYIDQMVRLITGQMGISPIILKAPRTFDLQLAIQEKTKKEGLG